MARQAATSRKAAAEKAVPAARAAKAAPRAGKAAAKSAAKFDGPKLDGLSVEQKVAHLLAERDALLARITRLEADLADQRAKQARAADRVAWALDSLRDILGERS